VDPKDIKLKLFWQNEFRKRLDNDQLLQELLKKRLERTEVIPRIKGVNDEFTPSNPLVILFWEGEMFWEGIEFDKNPRWIEGVPYTIRVTYDRNEVKKAHIVLLFIKDPNITLEPWQRFALLTLEAYILHNNFNILKKVSIYISFNQYSEVIINYKNCIMRTRNATTPLRDMPVVNDTINRIPNFKEKRRDALGSFFISNCNARDGLFRLEYITNLSKLVPLHSYGKCLHTEGIDQSIQYEKIAVSSTYLFSISFENSYITDYVTEKYYGGLFSDALMIYLGPNNLDDYLPNETARNGFINVWDYPDPRDLAKLLIYLSQNEEEYLNYFKWRTVPFDEKRFNNENSFINYGKDSWITKSAKWYIDHLEEEN